ncbi:MAG TPA: hypothetical protein ENI70_00775, partial [Candidatus Peregrinibacteria bacterium]|nr:hypothetical protein [Candidatus Peregrinibacteria bacterium]
MYLFIYNAIIIVTTVIFCIATIFVLYYWVRYVPYVPTDRKVVAKMLAAADLKKGQKVYDLGCGDG